MERIEIMKYLKTSSLLLTGLAGLSVFAVTAARAVDSSVIVTYAESPTRETSTLSGTQVDTVNNLPTGLNTNGDWNGVGSFDQLYIMNPGSGSDRLWKLRWMALTSSKSIPVSPYR